jgi:hypothetical protein
VLKDERCNLYQDVQGLLDLVKPSPGQYRGREFKPQIRLGKPPIFWARLIAAEVHSDASRGVSGRSP